MLLFEIYVQIYAVYFPFLAANGLAVYWIVINKYYNHPSNLINKLVRSIKDTFIPLVGNSPNTTNQKLLIYKQNQHYMTEGGQVNQSYQEANSGPEG